MVTRVTTKKESKLIERLIKLKDLISDEILISFTESGVRVLEMDTANVALIDVEVNRAAFSIYEPDGAGFVSIRTGDLVPILKRLKGAEEVTFWLNEDRSRVQIEAETGGKSRRLFELPLLAADESSIPKVPNLGFEFEATIDTGFLNQAVMDAGSFRRDIEFEYQPSDRQFYIKAEDISNRVEVSVDVAESDLVELHYPELSAEEHKAIKSRYSFDYLKQLLKSMKAIDRVRVSFDSTYPVRFVFENADGFKLTYILAPMVSND